MYQIDFRKPIAIHFIGIGGISTVDLKDRSDQLLKAVASVYAVHHRGNLL